MGLSPEALYSNLLEDITKFWITEGFPLDPEVRSGPLAAAVISIERSLLKKFNEGTNDHRDSRALLKFLQINSDCGNWSLALPDVASEELFGEFKRAVYNFWNKSGYPIVCSEDYVLHFARCGPGASLLARGGDAYTKMFASPLSATLDGLYESYRCYIRNFPEWANAESIRQAHFGEAHIVAGNRLCFVPKDRNISRTICTEPSLNMYFQLGFGHILELRLQELYGISLATQPDKNRELARIGSRTNEFATIDLSSASDSLSCKMISASLPKDFVSWLARYRSKYCELPGLGQHELNMISTMGNGYTFPLQTMLFTCVVLAAFSVNGLKPRFPRGSDYGNFGVFGDDIICPQEIVPDVYRLLGLLGFVVNKDKSFAEGPFRESCGHDYFRGRNIRGVYIKSIDTIQDRFAVINQLNQFSARTGVPLPRTVQSLVQSVPWTPVPRWENDDSGIQLPLSLVKGLPTSKRYQSILYTCYRVVGKKLRIGDNAVWVPRSSKPRIYNPSGLFICFLQRAVNAYTIGVRHDPPRYKRKQGVAPFWDAASTIHPSQGGYNGQRWETAVYLNLYG